MTPMVLLGTVVTHLFGGSVGREGAAVQMGAGLADHLFHRLKLSDSHRRHAMMAGIAGGFGSVFGTPLAATVFALEFSGSSYTDGTALLLCFVAAIVGNGVTRTWGIEHTHFDAISHLGVTPWILCKWLGFAIAIAITTTAFLWAKHAVKTYSLRYIVRMPTRMFVGGVMVVTLWYLSHGNEFLGLGVPTIARALHDPSLRTTTFAIKLLFTVVTLGTGYPGGEVTPLFFIGASLGNTLSQWLALPLSLGACVGMVSVFAAASNAPLALSIMAAEVFGVAVFPHALLVCTLCRFLTRRPESR
jgi:H+/Cl- antiporter ClcA